MTIQEKQAKLKHYLPFKQVSIVEAVVNAEQTKPTTQVMHDRVAKCVLAYLQTIMLESTTPRLFADVYQQAACQLNTYADLVQAGVSRFRRKNTHYRSNADMLAAMADEVVRKL